LANQIFIFGHGMWNVCDGAHWLEVMKKVGSGKFDFAPQPLKGLLIFQRLTASLKRCPDRKLEFFRNL